MTSVMTARILGPTGRGEYFYIMTLANLATQFGSIGLASSNTYAMAKNHALLARLAANSFWISLVVGLVAALFVLAINVRWSGQSSFATHELLIVVMVPAMLYCLLASNLLIGLSQIRLYNFFQIGSTALQIILITLSAYMSWSVTGFLTVSALTSLVAAAALWKLLASLHDSCWKFDWKLLQSSLGYASRAYLATLLGFSVSRVGVFLLERFASKTDVGVYSVAVQFGDMLIVVPATVAMVLFPELLRGPDEERFSRTIQALIRVALMMVVLCAITGVAATWILPMVFGKAFNPSVQVLLYMLPGVLALSLANIISQYLAAKGIPTSNIWAWLVALIFLVAAGTQFVLRWGAVGAAACLSLTYIFLATMLIFLACKHSMREARKRI